MTRFSLPLLALLLTGCGYGFKDEPPVYPPSQASGEVVVGRSEAPVASGEYQVQPGDTLYAIGFRNQIDYHDLASWNGIGSDYLIRTGQVLRLSAPADADTVRAAPLPIPVPETAAPQPIPVAPLPVAQAVVVKALPVGAPRWQWPTAGAVIKTYNPAAGSKGIDITGDLGQPVLAVSAGKVVYSGSALKGYGELIIVKHDDTYLSAYGHNRRRLVKEGDEVRAGQTIAELGVGPEQKPLVHFEIRENGKPVDPLQFLPAH